jgi:hypothetical protein
MFKIISHRNTRLIFDLIIASICSVTSVYFIYQWFAHGMPLLSNNGLPGSKEDVSVWLVAAGISLAVGGIASVDLYIYWEKDETY